jgi:hypothetical protein
MPLMSDRGSSTRRAAAVPAALGVAVCATLDTGAAHGVPILVDIPDVTVTGSRGVDFNGDGIAELTFNQASGSIADYTYDVVSVDTGGNAIVQSALKGSSYAAALAGGETIDASRAFSSGDSLVLAKFGLGFGEFDDAGLAYLGVRFTIPDDPAAHFGWVELATSDAQLTLTRLFWDSGERVAATTPGRSVPEPGTLALLVAGAAGVLAMRRRQRVTDGA